MPVVARKRGKKYRVVEKSSGAVAKNKGGTAADGGGHRSKAKAQKQASAINAGLKRKGKI